MGLRRFTPLRFDLHGDTRNGQVFRDALPNGREHVLMCSPVGQDDMDTHRVDAK
jgi:hypothetical protein